MFKRLILVLGTGGLVSSAFACSIDKPQAPSTAASAAETPGAQPTAPKSNKFAVSLGWQENESGQRTIQGYSAAFKELGWEYVVSNANYDPKLQTEQIDAFIKLNPRALFVTCSDPVSITQAVLRAIDARIPVFTSDCYIAGAKQITSIASNDYGMGMYTMSYIAKAIGGKGKVGMIGLPNNESWDLRELGARYVLKNYPNITIVYWPHDSTGPVTPRQAIENMMTANPELVAVWCAWDGAAMEGALAASQAGRDKVLFTGIDGGQRAFEQIQTGGPFKLSMAQSIYWMSYMNVMYAKDHLENKRTPRYVVAPVYAVTKQTLDAVPPGIIAADYDMPGMELKLGWAPVR